MSDSQKQFLITKNQSQIDALQDRLGDGRQAWGAIAMTEGARAILRRARLEHNWLQDGVPPGEDGFQVPRLDEGGTLEPIGIDREVLAHYQKAGDEHCGKIRQSRLAAQARWRIAVGWFREELHAGTFTLSYIAADGSQVTLQSRIFGTDDCAELFRSGGCDGHELLVAVAAYDHALRISKNAPQAEGETKTHKHGLPPPAAEPDPASFDPMRLARWTTPMAAAWIGTRDIGAVREQWNDWRGQYSNPQKDADGKWFQVRRRPASLLMLSHPNPDDPDADWLLTWYVLRQSLQDGDLVATGTDIQTGIPVDIPALHWQALEDLPKEPDLEPNFRFPKSQPPTGYDDVTVKRSDVLRIWPAMPDEDAVGVSPTALTPKLNAVLEAIETLSREKLAALPAKDRNKLIRDWLAQSNSPITVSDRTINRAMTSSRRG